MVVVLTGKSLRCPSIDTNKKMEYGSKTFGTWLHPWEKEEIVAKKKENKKAALEEEEEEGSTYSRVLLLFRLDARKPRQKKCRFSEASHSCRLVDLNTKLPRRLARCQIACLEEKHARTHAHTHTGANEDATERQQKKQESGKETKKTKIQKKLQKNSDDEEEGFGDTGATGCKGCKESQAGCRRRCEGKKEKKMDGENERDAKEKSRKTKGRGLAREEGAQDKNKKNASKGSKCGEAGNKSCVPSWP